MKRNNTQNFWSDIGFLSELREIKRVKQANDKKDYSDAEITKMIAQHPIFKELKKELISPQQQFKAEIRIHMDKRRGGLF